MESIYFYLGPQKDFWVVKLPRKQVGAIMKASHAENRLTILEIVVEIQPDQTPSMNRVKLNPQMAVRFNLGREYSIMHVQGDKQFNAKFVKL